jgi:hypothetical protein
MEYRRGGIRRRTVFGFAQRYDAETVILTSKSCSNTYVGDRVNGRNREHDDECTYRRLIRRNTNARIQIIIVLDKVVIPVIRLYDERQQSEFEVPRWSEGLTSK